MPLDPILELPSWWDEAECAGDPVAHELLFSSSEEAQKEAAQMYCSTCSVRVECQKAAMRVPASWDFGVWGGLTERERQKIRWAKNEGKNRAND